MRRLVGETAARMSLMEAWELAVGMVSQHLILRSRSPRLLSGRGPQGPEVVSASVSMVNT